MAKKCQDDLVRHGEAIPLPKDVNPQEKNSMNSLICPRLHGVSHARPPKDTYKRAGLKDIDDRTMVHIAFGYITGEPKSGDENGPSTTLLCAVDFFLKKGGGNPNSKQGQAWTAVRGPAACECHSRIWRHQPADSHRSGTNIETDSQTMAIPKNCDETQVARPGCCSGTASRTAVWKMHPNGTSTDYVCHAWARGQNWSYRVSRFNTVHLGIAGCRVVVEFISACKWPWECPGGTFVLEPYIDPHVDKEPKAGRTVFL